MTLLNRFCNQFFNLIIIVRFVKLFSLVSMLYGMIDFKMIIFRNEIVILYVNKFLYKGIYNFIFKLIK